VGFLAKSVMVSITVIDITIKNFTEIFAQILEKINFEHMTMRKCDNPKNGIKNARYVIRHNFIHVKQLRVKVCTCIYMTKDSESTKFYP